VRETNKKFRRISEKQIKNLEELSEGLCEKQIMNSQESEIYTSDYGGMLFPF